MRGSKTRIATERYGCQDPFESRGKAVLVGVLHRRFHQTTGPHSFFFRPAVRGKLHVHDFVPLASAASFPEPALIHRHPFEQDRDGCVPPRIEGARFGARQPQQTGERVGRLSPLPARHLQVGEPACEGEAST